MRVLDLDLDLFVSPIATTKDAYTRLCPEKYKPWSESAVRHFLEHHCGLSSQKKVLGRVITHHHEAFYFLRDLIQGKKATPPFELVHADAHADLGMGDAAYPYIMSELLHLSLFDRMTPDESEIGPGNYLVFAIACRWVSSLNYVHHVDGGDDVMDIHFKDFTEHSGFIQLKRCGSFVEDWDGGYNNVSCKVLSLEPPVQFGKVAANSYSEREKFDLIVLSKSPGFTPVTCDPLIEVVSEYIDQI
jgi:hypothetical protein